MINTICYQTDERAFFLELVYEKRKKSKEILTSISTRTIATFAPYLNQFSTLHKKIGSEFTLQETDERQALIDCYKVKTLLTSRTRGQIFSIQPDVLKTLCPYCMMDRPGTLDHYVPKEEFPEYAMFVRNLIPCCYKCNNRKDQLWRGKFGREFIHFYNDKLLMHQFLYSKLIFENPGAVPRIKHFLQRPKAMSQPDFAIARAHFENLALLPAYDESLNNRLSSEIHTIQQYVSFGVTDKPIGEILLDKFQNLSVSHGVNYFEAVIYQTLARQLSEVKLVVT